MSPDRTDFDPRLPASFLGNLSHELSSLIATHQSAAFLLRNRGQSLSGEKEARWLGAIDLANDNLRRLARQLSAIRNVLQDDLPSTPRAVSLPEWLANIEGCARLTETAAQVVLVIGIAAEGRWSFDEMRGGIALEAVLANALRFSPAGSEASLQVRAADAGLEFLLGDGGAGVPAEDLPQLFEPFYRGGNCGELPGCGLGLSTARLALTKIGGKITYVSAPAPHYFLLWLPARQVP